MIEAFRESKSSSLKKNSSRFHLKSCSVIVHVWEKLLLKIARCGGIVNPWGFITAVHLPMVSRHHGGLFKPPLKPLECHSDKIASGLCGGAHGCPIMPRDVRLSVKKYKKLQSDKQAATSGFWQFMTCLAWAKTNQNGKEKRSKNLSQTIKSIKSNRNQILFTIY